MTLWAQSAELVILRDRKVKSASTATASSSAISSVSKSSSHTSGGPLAGFSYRLDSDGVGVGEHCEGLTFIRQPIQFDDLPESHISVNIADRRLSAIIAALLITSGIMFLAAIRRSTNIARASHAGRMATP